jgi:prolyl-tRNA synthetase
MFSDAELIGIPKRVVISEKLLKDNQVELKKREAEEVELISLVQLHDILFT